MTLFQSFAAKGLILSLLLACQPHQVNSPVMIIPAPAASPGAEILAPASGSLMVSTLAGTGVFGYVDGPGDLAQFYHPSSLVLTPENNLLVLDRFNYLIREIKPNGEVSTYWGSGERGNRDGDSQVGRFNAAISMIGMSNGDLIIADAQNHSIRKLTPAGVLSTLIGSGDIGFVDGDSSLAALNLPADLAADVDGNLYIADRNNHAIRKLDLQGKLTTLAGNGEAGFANGSGAEARFNHPSGIALSPDGFLYVSDTDNQRIRKLSLTGEVSDFVGSGQAGSLDAQGSQAEFRGPTGLTFDAVGLLYVVDRFNHRIRLVTPQGEVSTLSGIGKPELSNGKAEQAAFAYPFDILVAPDNSVYIADYGNHSIRKIAKSNQ